MIQTTKSGAKRGENNSVKPAARETPPAAEKTPVPAPRRFAAIDFETADYGRDSACALSIVTAEDDRIVDTWTRLICPPRRSFIFTYLHGISWDHVKEQPAFAELYPEVLKILERVDFIAAHNASFDRSVLRACCEMSAAPPLGRPFLCTVKLARAEWDLHPTTLADVCRHLRIPLKHHNATSDATACAHIILAARRQGRDYAALLKSHGLKPARKPKPPTRYF